MQKYKNIGWKLIKQAQKKVRKKSWQVKK